MTPLLLAVSIVTLIGLGVALVAGPFGYSAPQASISVWAYGLLASAATVRLLCRFFPWDGVADAVIRAAVIGMAIVVGSTAIPGALGWLNPVSIAAGMAVVLASARFREASTRQAIAVRIFLPRLVWPLAVAGALLVLMAAYGLIHSPLTAYDSLSYHLFFPARWLQEHRLSIIPTPFSDEAQAYGPANGGLYFLWLMLPLHGDLLARIGQIPFLPLIGLTLYALARRGGASVAQAAWPALLCFVSRPMLEQAVGADVDLICWSLFLAALYLGLRGIDTGARRDWVLWGVAAGLYLGTKYVALVYAPVLFAFLFLKTGPRFNAGVVVRRALWALPGIAAFALPWYVRNWVIGGSPLYPASLGIAGVTLAQGAFSRGAMLHSVFHTTDLKLLPVMLAHAFGTTLIIAWVPLAIMGVRSMVQRTGTWPNLVLLCLPVVMTIVYWFGVPDNIDSRFMLPVAMLALLPVAFVFRTGDAKGTRRWNAVAHAACAAALVWCVIGVDAEIPATLPWFMGGWLSMRGLAIPSVAAALAALASLLWLMLRIAAPLRIGAVAWAAAIVLGTATLARSAVPACGSAPGCEFLQTTSIFLRPTFEAAWQWVDAHVRDGTVAYTGNNVPYPLAGPRLTNRVCYVNIDRHTTWRFHDYEHAARQRLNQAETDPLAVSSGVLLPLQARGPRVDAVRPRYSRMRGDRDAWIENLRQGGVTHLFVSALSAYEIDFVRHNAGGFPIEDDWARVNDGTFTLVYENPQVRIYSVTLRRRTT